MSTLPEIRKKDCTWDILQLYCRRAETRAQTILADFNKFSLRLSKQSNSIQGISSLASTSIQDIGYWENEFQRREKDIINTLKLLTTIIALLCIYPNPLPKQEFNDIIIYLEPTIDTYENGINNNNYNTTTLDPATVISQTITNVQQLIDSGEIIINTNNDNDNNNINHINDEQQHDTINTQYKYQMIELTQNQLTYSRRCLSILNDITVDFNRNKELCFASLNRMHLFTPQDYNNDEDDYDYGGDTTDDGDMSSSDVEAQLIQHEKKFGSKYNNKNRHKGNKNNTKSSSTHTHSTTIDTNQSTLSQEHSLISQSLQESQNAINNAINSQNSLHRQRDMFNNILNRVGQTVARFPGINTTLNAIQNRRHRDNFILATLVAFLMFISFLYVKWKHT